MTRNEIAHDVWCRLVSARKQRKVSPEKLARKAARIADILVRATRTEGVMGFHLTSTKQRQSERKN